jgi:hypothetical protein
VTVTRRVSRHPIKEDRLLQAVNKEIVPAVAELIENANAQDVATDARLDAAETLLVNHEGRIAALEEPVFEADYGDGVATVFNFVHNFGTYAVVATSWDNATRTRQALATESMPDVNTYRITLGAPPAASALHVAIGRLRG